MKNFGKFFWWRIFSSKCVRKVDEFLLTTVCRKKYIYEFRKYGKDDKTFNDELKRLQNRR